MLEYFAYKKVKKHQAEKHECNGTQTPKPVLSPDDERFLERLASEGTPPPLPERPFILNPEVGDSTGNDAQVELSKDKGKGKENPEKLLEVEKNEKPGKKGNRFSMLFTKSKKNDGAISQAEVEKEEDDITRVLNDLNLSAVNNRAFSLSKESNELVQKFTLVLKDLVNGVPTAYDDLVALLEDSQGTLANSYEHLPSFLQKLITTLPQKLTSSLAPELLAVATEAQGVNMEGAGTAAGGGFMGAAKGFLKPNSLKDLVTKPGAVAGMLRAIMNTLKLRWPAFMGTNVLLSLGLFILLFVFWYCHKRGREVRLATQEKANVVGSEGRIVELDDDPLLEPGPSRSPRHRHSRDGERIDRSHREASQSHSRRHSRSGESHRTGQSHRSERHDEREHHRHSKHKP